MSDTVISVESVGKKYRIGSARKSDSLRDALQEGVNRLGRRLTGRSDPKPNSEEFWALQDVSFEVKRGECVGIIGRNGAGKSTLLKILSRITEPTTGQIRMKGRVGSLLEVGTGFHPELTGRENIFLNGAILGMGRSEIARKFDEIVAFSEIEKFLDTPVKFYSSGMYTRLAFSVAAHLEPEILIIDEVLAVGDVEFQKKCLGKINDVANFGRTVLLVSHQMQSLQAITKRGILFDSGRILMSGATPLVIREYLGSSRGAINLARIKQDGTGEALFTKVTVLSGGKKSGETVELGEDLEVTIDFVCVTENLAGANLAFSLRNGDGIELFSHSLSDQTDELTNLKRGSHSFAVVIPTINLKPGNYWLTLFLAGRGNQAAAAITGINLPALIRREKRSIDLDSHRWGVMYVPCSWRKLDMLEAHTQE